MIVLLNILRNEEENAKTVNGVLILSVDFYIQIRAREYVITEQSADFGIVKDCIQDIVRSFVLTEKIA